MSDLNERRDYHAESPASPTALPPHRPHAADATLTEHQWEEVAGYDVEVRKGFTALKDCAYTATAENAIRDFRETVAEKSKIAQGVFGGFQRCLYPAQKFQSDTERKLSIILDRESEKWFKPALGQFQIFYTSGRDQKEYQPDFVAETTDAIYMHKPKARNEMTDQEVLAKRDAAVQWCHYATQHALANGGKAWHYLLTRIIHVGCVKSALSMWCVAQVISLAAQSVLRETIDLPT